MFFNVVVLAILIAVSTALPRPSPDAQPHRSFGGYYGGYEGGFGGYNGGFGGYNGGYGGYGGYGSFGGSYGGYNPDIWP